MGRMLDRREERSESVALAAQDVLDAGERIAFDWLELLRVEWTERARSLAREFAVTGAGIALLIFAWVLATAALVVGIDRWLELEASLGAVAVGEGALGAYLLLMGRRGRSTS